MVHQMIFFLFGQAMHVFD